MISGKTAGIRLNSFQLKCVAILSMAVDHTGAVLFPEALWLRGIGRLAFPLFAFLLAEGFIHTRDVRRYLLRLGLFALVSEIPYDLAFQGTMLEFGHQNVFFTLGISLLVLYCMDQTRNQAFQVAAALCGMGVSEGLHTDYGSLGVLLVLIYALLRDRIRVKIILGALWNFMWQPGIQYLGALASLPIALYNGEQGRKMKYLFYVFYPVHLLVLRGIQMCF